jgi:hypothetical protein
MDSDKENWSSEFGVLICVNNVPFGSVGFNNTPPTQPILSARRNLHELNNIFLSLKLSFVLL